MESTNTFLEDRMNMQAIYSRKSVDIQWTQQLINPLQEYYVPGQQIRLILQRSRHMIPLDEIGLSFRPVISYGKDDLPDIARKSFLCITPVLASDFFQVSSITFNGNQLLAQSSVQLDKPRGLFQNYYNSLVTRKKHSIDFEEYYAGLLFPGYQGSGTVGCEEISITHPQDSTGIALAQRVDVDPYPRAVLSKIWSYNMEHNLAPSDGPTITSNAYYAGYMDANGDEAASFNSGNVPIATANNGDTVNYNSNFPLMGLMVSASVAQYKACQERFQKMRMRFITATTSCYAYTGTVAIQTTDVPTAPQKAGFNKAQQFGIAGPTSITQRVAFGTSVQGPYGTGNSSLQGGVSRYNGQLWTAANATCFPREQFSNLYVELGQLSIELSQIGTICMDSTQNANQVLSAYLQSSFIGQGAAVAALPGGGANTGNCGASSADCQTFLRCCLIGSATYKITDVVCRVPYYSYPESSYPIVRELLYQPIPYQSLRQQADPITSTSSQFTQRISIGGSALVNAVWCFIVPMFQPISSGVVRPQDCVVDYTGCNVPSLGDLRCIPQLDSCYLPFTQFSIQLDNKLYEASPLIPIANNQYATYLKAMEGLETVFGKVLPMELRSYMTNRFNYCVAINPKNNREQMMVDQQLIVSVTFDDTARREQAALMGTQRQTCNNGSFYLLTYVITSQSVVNCDYVKI